MVGMTEVMQRMMRHVGSGATHKASTRSHGGRSRRRTLARRGPSQPWLQAAQLWQAVQQLRRAQVANTVTADE